MILLILITLLALLLFVFSYALMDHGLMLFLAQSKPIVMEIDKFRALMIYNRHYFSTIFVLIVLLLTVLQIYLLLKKNFNINKILITALILTLIASFSYPFLSHDIFTYLISAKMFFVYHLNPYKIVPEVLRDTDIWISFTHWTHRIYVYGPLFLIYSYLPMLFFGISKFLTIFYSFKLMNGILFYLSGLVLLKIAKEKRLVYSMWFFNPLIILDILVNTHNEIVMISLFIFAVFFFNNNKRVWGSVSLLASITIKFVSVIFAPYFILKDKYKETFLKLSSFLLLIILGLKYQEVQTWYYTWLYMPLLFIKLKNQTLILIIFFQTLLIFSKYFAFIDSGNWEKSVFNNFDILFLILPAFIVIFEKQELKNLIRLISKSALLRRNV